MKKIMFNEHFGLQQSVLDGTKDMTRRICTMTLHRKLENGTMEAIEPDDMFVASGGTSSVAWTFLQVMTSLPLPIWLWTGYRATL